MASPMSPPSRPVLLVHGGAGTIARDSMTPEREALFRRGLAAALAAGQRVLLNDGSSVDAVIAAVNVLEDDPLFNAGHGAVFTSHGRNELDASIMDGQSRQAGAVAGVTRIRNPISAAHKVMTASRHVLLGGAGAEHFAEAQGLAMVDPSYFHTDHRWRQLEEARRAGTVLLDHDGARPADQKFGTVGAVACDRNGHVAAATSTGGMTNKQWGRIGDSPIIGAGTYADDATCAVSGTGTGEAFIRAVAAYEVAALMKYKRLSLAAAVDEVATVTVPANGGQGGLIAVDAMGNAHMSFSTEGMYRGLVRGNDPPEVAIYR